MGTSFPSRSMVFKWLQKYANYSPDILFLLKIKSCFLLTSYILAPFTENKELIGIVLSLLDVLRDSAV